MKIHIKKYFWTICAFIFIFTMSPAYAQTPTSKIFGSDLSTRIKNIAGIFTSRAGFREVDLPVLVATVIQALLSLLAIIFIGLIIYGGYKWMMARGNDDVVEEARGIIRNAIYGLIVTMSSYAIGYFFLYWLSTAGTGVGTPVGP